MKLRILLVEDHDKFREVLHWLLAQESDIAVVAETDRASCVNALVTEHHPHVVCMDLALPDLDGISATKALLRDHPDIKVIGLSAHEDHENVRRMLQAGAVGYVRKFDAGKDLAPAIRAALKGQVYTSPAIGFEVPKEP